MDEHDDFVNVSRVLDFSKDCSVFHGDETLCDNLGFGEDDGDEIMVEIVGSDVFVDGVGGNEMSGNDGDVRELGNGGVIGDLGLWEGGFGTGVGGFEDNAGGDDFVNVVEEEVDVVEEEVDVVVNDNVVEDYGVIEDVKFFGDGDGLERRDEVTGSGDMCCGNGDGLERRDEVTGSGDMCCVLLTTPSAHECSGMRDEALSCESEISAGNCMVATWLSSGETEVVGGEMTCCFNKDNRERMVENFDDLVSQIGFLGYDASNADTDSGFRSSSAIGKTKDISEQVSVEVKERGLNCKDQVVHNDIVDAESHCLETVPSTSVERQALVSETGTVQQMKAIESFGNDVAQEQHDMVILSEGIVEASVETIFDENMDFNSKTKVLDGDTNLDLVEDKYMSGLDLRGSVAVNEEKKDDIQNPDVKPSGSLCCEDDESKILNQPLTDAILNKGDSHPAIPHIIGEVTCGPEAVLSSDMLHREGKAVQYFANDFPSHLPVCNRNSIVNVMSNDRCLCPEDEVKGRYVSDGVTSDELVHLTFERRDNKPVMCSLVDNMGTFCNKEEKNLQGAHLDGNVSPSYDINCVDSNVQGTERNIDLQFSECLDASSTGNHTGVTSDQDHILEVEEKYNEEQVDVRTDQEMEIQDETINFGESEVINEKIAEEVSPSSASSITEFHSRYLLPPNNEGEFSVSDLVWSKDRSYPWWPGQIFNPADASEKVMKHHKNDCFLVAYFGDRAVAWNDTSRIRPFKTHFSQIEEQRNSEVFHHAVSCALVEVSRRVQLGLACSCIPKNSFAEIESQIVENIGIHQEAGRRYGVDESTAASCFKPEELLEHIRSLALLSSAGADGRLQLTISKAQLAAFSRFKGHHPLPEFHLCGGLLENDANTSRLSDVIQEHSEQVKGGNNTSSKRKHNLADSLPPRKKERSKSELIGDMLQSDGEEELDSVIGHTSVTSSATRKRKALNSVTDGSGRTQNYYAAKVSATASQTPKQSFKVGECILRVASRLTGSPSLVNCNSEKFLGIDDSVDQHPGFDYFPQTPVNSQQGLMLPPKYSSIDEMLSQLHLAAQDPMEGYSFLNEITTFFSGFRRLVAMGQNFRRWNQSTGGGDRIKKAPHSVINSSQDFEFDDVTDSYWTDRIVQNYGEEQLLDRAQNGEAENQQVPYEADKEQILDRAQNGEDENQQVPYEADKEQILDRAQNGEAENQLVPCEADKPVKSGQRSQKRFSSGKHVMAAEEPVVEHIDNRRPDCSPTELILKFTEGKSVPSELNLNKIFRRFGPLREPETKVDRESSCAKVVYKWSSDAKVALSSAGIFNIFGPTLVSYELSNVPSSPFKTLPAATVQDQEDAS